jgi:hypothetical protein
VESSALGQV